MADPVTSESTTGAAASGSTGQQTANDLASVIAQGVAAAVTASLQELTNKLNTIQQSIESRVKQTSANEDANFETSVVGVDDPYENKRRDRLAYDGLITFAMAQAAVAAENTNLIVKQHLRHADLAVARHWGTAPITANPEAAAPKAT